MYLSILFLPPLPGIVGEMVGINVFKIQLLVVHMNMYEECLLLVNCACLNIIIIIIGNNIL